MRHQSDYRAQGLATAAQLMLISDIRDFLDRQEQGFGVLQREAKAKADGC
jgi:hypothetical protein